MSSRNGRTVTISLPPGLAREIDRVAKTEGRTRSELFRAAVQQYLDRRRRWADLTRAAREIARRKGIVPKDVAAAVTRDRRRRRTWSAK
jgi:predicted transcriptional regulator